MSIRKRASLQRRPTRVFHNRTEAIGSDSHNFALSKPCACKACAFSTVKQERTVKQQSKQLIQRIKLSYELDSRIAAIPAQTRMHELGELARRIEKRRLHTKLVVPCSIALAKGSVKEIVRTTEAGCVLVQGETSKDSAYKELILGRKGWLKESQENWASKLQDRHAQKVRARLAKDERNRRMFFQGEKFQAEFKYCSHASVMFFSNGPHSIASDNLLFSYFFGAADEQDLVGLRELTGVQSSIRIIEVTPDSENSPVWREAAAVVSSYYEECAVGGTHSSKEGSEQFQLAKLFCEIAYLTHFRLREGLFQVAMHEGRLVLFTACALRWKRELSKEEKVVQFERDQLQRAEMRLGSEGKGRTDPEKVRRCQQKLQTLLQKQLKKVGEIRFMDIEQMARQSNRALKVIRPDMRKSVTQMAMSMTVLQIRQAMSSRGERPRRQRAKQWSCSNEFRSTRYSLFGK